LAPLIAVMQTVWVATGNTAWYRLTRFFGKLFLINFALGVATGIVQEFQFGMNWSEYSRFVGDVFGAPLAMEGLAAFFFESTFLGLWIFGWTRLPRLVHLACIWIVAVAVNLSAFFIIAANSFMQHPVGARYNPETGRAELTSIVALFTNNTATAAFSHAVAGAFLTAGTFVAGVCAWWMVRAHDTAEARTMYRPAAILGCLVTLVAAAGLFFTGDIQGKLMFKQQPMKMASAESLCHSETDPDFSFLTIGTHNNCDSVTHVIEVPYVLPYLAEGKFSGVHLEGVKDLQAQYEEKFGPGGRRVVADQARANPAAALVLLVRIADTADPVPRQQCRLGVHRDGPSALGGGAEPNRGPVDSVDRGRRRFRSFGRCGGDLAGHVHGVVCGAGGHLVLADPAIRRRGAAGARLRARTAEAAGRRRSRAPVVRILRGGG
jgi:cytochrome bd-type quinol oxidase subunit 1